MSGKSKMAEFVNSRSGNPIRASATSSGGGFKPGSQRREQISADAKIKVPHTKLSIRPGGAISKAEGRNLPKDGDFASRSLQHRFGDATSTDPYETDVEHLDDTIQSTVHVLDSQVDTQGIPYARRSADTRRLHKPASETSEDRNEDDMAGEADDDFGDDEDFTQRQLDFTQAFEYGGEGFNPDQAMRDIAQGMPRNDTTRSLFADSLASYPTESSGRIEDDTRQFDADRLENLQGRRSLGSPAMSQRAQSPAKQQYSLSQRPMHSSIFPQAQNTTFAIDSPQHQSPAKSQYHTPGPSLSISRLRTSNEIQPANGSRRTPSPSHTIGHQTQHSLHQKHESLPSDTSSTSSQLQQLPNASEASHGEPSMDYPPDVIISKKFEELEKEGFDHDPKTATTVQPQEPAGALSVRLSRLQSSGAKEQQKLFSSLTLDEWEEAGDWFLGQFGEILNRMKKCRKRRRTQAAELETEIAQRHRQVQKRKQYIQSALDDMRQSGSNMLNSTPKRKRV